jgi:hypothetical protein
MRLVRILPARRALPGPVPHVTISHAAYAPQVPEFLLVSAQQPAVCVGSPTERRDTALLCGQKFSKPIIWRYFGD